MKRVDWKQRFAAEHQLVHLDPTILDLLLDHPDPVTSDAVGALAKELLSSVVIDLDLDLDQKAPNGWRARIKASLPEVDGGDDDDDDIDEAAFLIEEEDREPLLPPDIRAELQADIARAADELRPLRDAIKRERPVAKARPTTAVVLTTIQPRKADWAKWLAMPSWTTAETAALLLDLDPFDVKPPGKNLPGEVRLAFAAKLDHVARHAGAGNLKDPMTPDAVKAWASTHKQEVPVALRIPAAATDAQIGNKKDGELHHLTLKIFHHTLLYLAVAHHDYSPIDVAEGKAAGKPAKSHAPKTISKALRDAGFEGSDRAIRDHLSKAVEAFQVEYGDAALRKLTAHRKLPSNKL